jgi:hypothetical protein
VVFPAKIKVNIDASRADVVAALDIVELSLLVAPSDDEPPVAFESQVAAEQRRLEAAVRDLGLPIDSDNDTKTQRVSLTRPNSDPPLNTMFTECPSHPASSADENTMTIRVDSDSRVQVHGICRQCSQNVGAVRPAAVVKTPNDREPSGSSLRSF